MFSSRIFIVLAFNFNVYVLGVILNLRQCSLSYGEGNGTPLQYSCLENPRDGGAW